MKSKHTLTPVQKRAMDIITTEWQSAYSLQIGRNTLDALVRKGLVERKAGLGEFFSSSTAIKYRLKS